MDMQKKLEFDFKTNQRIFSKISEVEKFQGKWEHLEKSGKSLLKELRHIATIQSIGSSTRIEGSKLSDKDIKSLLEHLEINNLETRDEQEVVGYWEVLELTIENSSSITLTENHLMQLHSILLKYSEKDIRQRGKFKNLTNKVVATYPDGSQKDIFTTTEPHLVSKEMTDLLEWTNRELEKKEINVILIIATFVYEFLSIHPFHDGNGRLSRILTTLLLVKESYFFVQFVSFEHIIEERKKEYYKILMACQKNRYSENEKIDLWIEFFLDCLISLSKKLEAKLQRFSLDGDYINPRQKKIISLIQTQGSIKLAELDSHFSEVSIHTLKKDLKLLVEKELINKSGDKKGAFYFIESLD